MLNGDSNTVDDDPLDVLLLLLLDLDRPFVISKVSEDKEDGKNSSVVIIIIC